MSETIHIKLPDGSEKEVPKGTTPLQVAKDISPRLADAALAAKVSSNGDQPALIDVTRPLEKDTKLELLTERNPEALEIYRHSAAHVLATAVLELFPETKLGHGPATDNGFFYDFYREKPFTPEDLALIEAKMAEVVARDEKFVHEFEPREKALAEFDRDGDFMKTHFVSKFTEPGSQVSFYRNGKF